MTTNRVKVSQDVLGRPEREREREENKMIFIQSLTVCDCVGY